MRTMRALGLLALALLVATTASAAAPIEARLTTSTPTPAVGQAWRYTVTVRSAAATPLAARMRLQLLVGTTVVGCWKGGEMAQCLDGSKGDWISFRGRRSGVLRFPAESVGARLTFQAVVQASRQTRRLRAAVTVKPAP
jgi:hypothetical protein